MTRVVEWTATDAAAYPVRPATDDDKYSRGVLGVATGSDRFPGAAVLGVSAALATGVGMVRFRGVPRAEELVLHACPEAVPATGRVQAWLVGSGMEADQRVLHRDVEEGLADPSVPFVLDAGALDLRPSASTVVTPHARELARLTGTSIDRVTADPVSAAAEAARGLGVVVTLKGHRTVVASPSGLTLLCPAATPWLATAGTGDALAGIMGAFVATHWRRWKTGEDSAVVDELARVAASAVVVHSLAADRASAGGPFTVRALVREIPDALRELLA